MGGGGTFLSETPSWGHFSPLKELSTHVQCSGLRAPSGFLHASQTGLAPDPDGGSVAFLLFVQQCSRSGVSLSSVIKAGAAATGALSVSAAAAATFFSLPSIPLLEHK